MKKHNTAELGYICPECHWDVTRAGGANEPNKIICDNPDCGYIAEEVNDEI